MRIGVIGLGKLGLPMAALFADKGHEVTGLDVNTKLVECLRRGECPINETGLVELLKQQTAKFTTSFHDTMDTEISFVIVPTPSSNSGQFSSEYVLDALTHLRGYEGLVVITSTVMPGSCEREFKPMLPHGQLCYSPEFVALGAVISGMLRPDAILIGESDERSGNTLVSFYDTICSNDPPVCRMSLWNAEIAKLALNVSVTMKIGLANTIADVCERIPTGDANAVTTFIGLDRRIGGKYFSAGLGFGGPCFPRDGRAFIQTAWQLGLKCPVQLANDEFNSLHDMNVAARASKLCRNKGTVSILGLTYKADTNVVEESGALKIAQSLSRTHTVRVYDPQGMPNAEEIFWNKVTYCTNATECLKGSSLCVIATPWREFANLDFGVMKTPVVLDCWGLLRNADLKGVDYHAIGVSDV